MRSTLTTLQAFNAMTKFLDAFYMETKSDDVGSLLSDISFLLDGCTADPAAWHDWMDAIGTDKPVTVLQAFTAMKNFLKAYHERTSCYSQDLQRILDGMEFNNGKVVNACFWDIWLDNIAKSMQEPEGSRHYLEFEKNE